MTTFLIPPDLKLEDDRVLLRPLQMEDWSHLLSISENEPENWAFGLENASGSENLQKYIKNALVAQSLNTAFPFIIFDKLSQTYAGSTRYYLMNASHLRLAIGYSWISNAHKKTGLNSHVKYLMLSYAFESLPTERVEFMADANNGQSIRSILSLGATKEGILRSHAVKPDGSRRDTVVFSILKKEWLEHVKPSLHQKINSIL
jgi:RimJ/RimL family protein N-acetyltransferase